MSKENSNRTIPEQYIIDNIDNSELPINCKKENNLTEEQTNQIIEALVTAIRELDSIKKGDKISRIYIREKLPKYRFPQSVVFENWLVSALRQDDQFTYSYNALAQHINRRTGQGHYPIKTDKRNFEPQVNDNMQADDEKLKMAEVALILVYNSTRLLDPVSDHSKNADEIAKKHGFVATTSGLKLYRQWKKYNEPIGITGFDETTEHVKIKNMIKRITKILPHLNGQALEAAEKDIKILEMKQ